MKYTRKDIVEEFDKCIDQTPKVEKDEQRGLSLHASVVLTKFLFDKIAELQNAIDELRTEMYDRYDRK